MFCIHVILHVFDLFYGIDSLCFFGALSNHNRANQNKPTIEYAVPFRAAMAKLAKLLSDRRRSALKGTDKKSPETARARYRWKPELVAECALNVIEYTNDPTANAEHPYVKCFWDMPPEHYKQLSRLLVVSTIGTSS